MKRIVSVWFPHWPMQRLRRRLSRSARSGEKWENVLSCSVPDKTPFALVETVKQKVVITALNRAGHEAGLLPGMALADARAQVPELASGEAMPEKDAADLKVLALWCNRYGAAVNVDGPDGIWIDISGVAHLYDGEAALLHDLRCRLKRGGLTVRLAGGDTRAAAWALARFGRGVVSAGDAPGVHAIADADYRHCILPVDMPVSMLSRLPVAALQIDDTCELLLRRLGLKTIGHLIDIPRTSLKRRFPSKEGAHAVMSRLDLLLGRAADVMKPLAEPRSFCARLAFPEPLISTEPLENAVAGLCEDLSAQLRDGCTGARSIRLLAYRSDGSAASLYAGFGRPSYCAQHMMRILREKLPTIDAGFGIDLLTLDALVADQTDAAQPDFVGDLADAVTVCSGGDAQELMDRLVNRVGRKNVYRIAPHCSHLPERSQRRVSPFDDQRTQASAQDWRRDPADEAGGERAIPPHAVAIPKDCAGDDIWCDPVRPWGLRAQASRVPRPSFLLPKPEAIRVLAEVPEGPPSRFVWRNRTLHVVQAEGPERIADEWWRHIGLPAPDDLSKGDGAAEHEGPCAGGGLPLLVSEAPVQRKLKDGDDRGQRDVELLEALVPERADDDPLIQNGDEEIGMSTVLRRVVLGQRPRDYYRVAVREGGAFWLYREGLYQTQHEQGAPTWYLHGVFH